jgi:adenylate cyclase
MSPVALRSTIAAKIFGLAVILLLITIALVGYLVIEVDRTRREMDIVAHHDIPLAGSVFLLEEYGLRRRLAFERWNGTLDSEKPNESVLKEASENYGLFTTKIQQHIAGTRKQIQAHPVSPREQPRISEAKVLLEQIEKGYDTITAQQQQVLALQKAGDHGKANALLNFLNDHQRTLQSQREALVQTLSAVSADAANAAAARQQTVLWLVGAATISAISLGLIVAAFVTRRLVVPIKSLVSAVQEVEKGRLDIQVPVLTQDEVGQLAGAFGHFVGELRVKEEIKQTFGKYIDPRVMEQVLAQNGVGKSLPERRVMTVLFADLVGFTGLSEQLTASRMVDLLNRHFSLQAFAVQEHHGVVDKFIGDAVMAFWGPPFVPASEQAALACRAAIAQARALDILRSELAEITGLRKNAPAVDLRIGVCTGDVVVGNVGAENTRSYTVMGDTVNLASRLEGANRIYGTTILVAETTAQLLGDEFLCLEIDAIEVKGKSEFTRIFDLAGLRADTPPNVSQACASYAEALRRYRAREWGQAEACFRRCIELRPGYGPASVFLDRIAALRLSPPDNNWTGVHRLDQK